VMLKIKDSLDQVSQIKQLSDSICIFRQIMTSSRVTVDSLIIFSLMQLIMA
jgi:hypothetical protein